MSREVDELDGEGSEDTPATSNAGALVPHQHADELGSNVHSRSHRGGDLTDQQLSMHESFATADYVANLAVESAQGAESQALVSVNEGDTHSRAIVPQGEQSLVSSAGGARALVPQGEQSLVSSAGGTRALVPQGQQALVSSAGDVRALVPQGQQALVSVNEGGELNQSEASSRLEYSVATEATGQERAMLQSMVSAEENRMVPVGNQMVPVMGGVESQMVPVSTENHMVAAANNEEQLVDGEENRLVPAESRTVAQQQQQPASELVSRANITRYGQQPEHGQLETRPHYEDDVSLSTAEVFGQVRLAAAAFQSKEDATVQGNKSFESELNSQWTKPYDQQRAYDDETINTYESDFWNKKTDRQPDTIYEGADETDDPSRRSSRFSNSFQQEPSSRQFDGRASISSHATSSVRSSPSVYTETMGVVPRPGPTRRMDRSREVEVSMDGFLHQVKPTEPEHPQQPVDYLDFQPILVDHSRPRAKLSNAYRMCTVISACCLAATMMFFAVHVGPFYQQTPRRTTGGTSTTGGDENTQSSFELIQPLTNSFPDWMTYTFVDWRRSYLGVSKEVPFIWTMEQSGGEIFVETMGVCMNKVVAGNGRQHDPDGEHGELWQDDSFKILTVNGGQRFINVDLYSVEGVIRAGDLELTQSRVAEVIDTPFLKEGAMKLFTPASGELYASVAGRLMVIMRDPMLRALNRYEQTKITTGDDAMTLSDYWNNPLYSENNPLTRSILGFGPNDPLDRDEIELAQKIVNRHVLVGLYDDGRIEESILRFEQFLHWHNSSPQTKECRTSVLSAYERGYRVDPEPYRVSDPLGYNMLASDHGVDNLIFAFAKRLFDVQGEALSSQQQS